MRTMPALLMAVIAIVYLSSCQKEVDPGALNAPHSPTSDSTVLSRYAELDTTYAAGLDTSYIYMYSYDAQKRLVSVKTYIGDNTTPGPPRSDSIMTTYYYNGTSITPFKILSFHTYFSLSPGCDTTYLTYSG